MRDIARNARFAGVDVALLTRARPMCTCKSWEETRPITSKQARSTAGNGSYYMMRLSKEGAEIGKAAFSNG